MGFLWIGAAFVCGLIAKRLNQEPILGFLAAGFAMEFAGVTGGDGMAEVAEVGVQLLLFTIGLKLDLRSLLRPHVWGTALGHMAIFGAISAGLLMLLMMCGLPPFDGLSVQSVGQLAFALTFSSTIVAVRVLEDRNDLDSFYGRASIGILVVQDIAAVTFIVLTSGKVPSIWALGVFALIPLRPLFARILRECGHGEVLALAGLTATLGFATLAEYVGLKPDLGALIAGLLLGGNSKTNELAKSLLSFKDVFLVGFFVSVGLTGLPTWENVGAALVLLLLFPLKGALFFLLATRFRLRGRTSFLMGLSLTQYSEFGLIVLAALVSKELIDPQWLVTMALAVAFSFLLSARSNARGFRDLIRLAPRLAGWQSETRLPDEEPVDLSVANTLVFGMGRVGTAAYDVLKDNGLVVVGVDVDMSVVESHRDQGRNAVHGSGTDAELWERMHLGEVEWVLLAMASQVDHLAALEQLKAMHPDTKVAVLAHYIEDIEKLEGGGADIAVHVQAEAGAGFASHVLEASGLGGLAREERRKENESTRRTQEVRDPSPKRKFE